MDSQFMPPNLTGRSSSHGDASAAWAAPVYAKTTAAAARSLTWAKRIGFCLHRFRDTTHAGGLRYAVELRGLCGSRADRQYKLTLAARRGAGVADGVIRQQVRDTPHWADTDWQ